MVSNLRGHGVSFARATDLSDPISRDHGQCDSSFAVSHSKRADPGRARSKRELVSIRRKFGEFEAFFAFVTTPGDIYFPILSTLLRNCSRSRNFFHGPEGTRSFFPRKFLKYFFSRVNDAAGIRPRTILRSIVKNRFAEAVVNHIQHSNDPLGLIE